MEKSRVQTMDLPQMLADSDEQYPFIPRIVAA
jgi:hypothetical protein